MHLCMYLRKHTSRHLGHLFKTTQNQCPTQDLLNISNRCDCMHIEKHTLNGQTKYQTRAREKLLLITNKNICVLSMKSVLKSLQIQSCNGAQPIAISRHTGTRSIDVDNATVR